MPVPEWLFCSCGFFLPVLSRLYIFVDFFCLPIHQSIVWLRISQILLFQFLKIIYSIFFAVFLTSDYTIIFLRGTVTPVGADGCHHRVRQSRRCYPAPPIPFLFFPPNPPISVTPIDTLFSPLILFGRAPYLISLLVFCLRSIPSPSFPLPPPSSSPSPSPLPFPGPQFLSHTIPHRVAGLALRLMLDNLNPNPNRNSSIIF